MKPRHLLVCVIEAAGHDVRYALRACRQNPGFSFIAVLTLAIGIGANTAIFSLVNAVLLRPLPYPESSRMVWFLTTAPEGPYADASDVKYNAWRSVPSTFDSVAAFSFRDMTLAAGDHFESVTGADVTADFFRLFGAHTQAGRTFTRDDDRPGGANVTIISDAFWARRFQRGPAIGQTLHVNGQSYIVIGVLQSGFDTTTLTSADFAGPDVWLPLRIDPASTRLEAQFAVAGRLLPSVSLAEAQSRVASVGGDLRRRFPTYVRAGDGTTVEPLQAMLVRHDREALLALLAAAGLVLLLACANVANLLLARGASRRGEMVLRAALGATRGRLVRQLVTESVLLGATGGVAGFVVGRLAIDCVVALTGPTITRIGVTGHSVPLDARVFAFTTLMAGIAVLACGFVPAWIASYVDLSQRLHQSDQSHGSSRGHRRLGGLLTAAEVGIAVVLLVAAGLFIRTVANLAQVQPGFDTHRLLALQVMASPSVADQQTFDQRTRAASLQAIQERLRAIPGVVDVTASCCLPFINGDATLRYIVDGRPLDSLYHGMGGWRPVASHYFETLRIPVVAGRAFAESDSWNSPGVVIINQAMAEKWWPHGGALGQRITLGKGIGGVWEEPPREIVGIVANVRDAALDLDAQPTNYVPLAQLKMPLQLGWLVRTSGDPDAVRPLLEQALQRAAGGLPVSTVGQMDTLIHQSTAKAAFRMWLMAAFATVALLLATVGVYGLMAYAVQRRTREIGIRIAIGAEPGEVIWLIVMTSLRYSFVGIVVGTAFALMTTRVLKSFLFGLSPSDPVAFGVAVTVLAVTTTIAAWIPARRAAAVDPVNALRAN